MPEALFSTSIAPMNICDPLVVIYDLIGTLSGTTIDPLKKGIFFSNNFLTFSSLYLLILSNNWRNCGLTVTISFEMGQGYPGTAYNGENFGQFDFDCALWSRFSVPSLSFKCKKVDTHKFDIITGSLPY